MPLVTRSSTDRVRPDRAGVRRAAPVHPAGARLLRLLRDEGPRAHAELADALRMSRAELTAEIHRLTAAGLVEVGGRRAPRLSGDLRFAGIDIGATSIDVAVTGGDLTVLDHRSRPYDVRRGPRAVLETALEMLDKLHSEGVAVEIAGVGVGLPGPVGFRAGRPGGLGGSAWAGRAAGNRMSRIGTAPSSPIMPDWDASPISEAMRQELGCPVLVDQDVNLMVLGELAAGPARTVDDVLLVKIGTRIGCGVVVGGSVYRGASGYAGDIGHIRVTDSGPVCACGGTGCLEAHFGGDALTRDAIAAARGGDAPYLAGRLAIAGRLTAADMADAVAAGDAAAMRIVRDGGRHVGQALAGLVNFFNPGLVIIAGGVAGLGHTLLAEIRGVVHRRSTPLAAGNLPIVRSELGALAGVIGGARLISDRVFSAAVNRAP